MEKQPIISMKKLLLLLSLSCFCTSVPAQMWVDTLYGAQTTLDLDYGTAVDFAGTARDLKMDVTVPVGDTPPPNGRPLLVIVHGGAWLGGDKAQGFLPRLRDDFAKRGYVTASVSYRLGMFQTQVDHNCNISYFGVAWNCLQQQDTTEWIRANYRAQQDVRGAVRKLVQDAALYNIDPANVFLVGESAGGFIAMQVAYLDDPTERPDGAGLLPNALAPNARYEGMCIQGYGWATSIAAMDLSRPDLGPYQGDLNPADTLFCIRGVGSLYGGMPESLFDSTHAAVQPALYLFHQPRDLVVPFGRDRVLRGYSDCAYGACGQGIYNRPWVYGGKGIQELLDTLAVQGRPVPDYYADFTTANLDCAGQVFANQPAHALDNYWLRTTNMAAFFAGYIDTTAVCTGTSSLADALDLGFEMYPNPAGDVLRLRFPAGVEVRELVFRNVMGQELLRLRPEAGADLSLVLPDAWPNGTVLLSVEAADGRMGYRRLVLQR